MKKILVVQGGGGDTNGKPRIDETPHLQRAYDFGKSLYPEETL